MKDIQKALLAVIPYILIRLLFIFAPEETARFDQSVTDFVIQFRNGIADIYFRLMTTLANEEFVIIAILVMLLVVVLAFRKWRVALIYLIGVVVGNLGVNSSLKNVFKRERPAEELRLVSESSFSFPSGHSFASAMIYPLTAYILMRYTGLGRYPRTVAVVVTLIVLSIGFSRIYLGVHFLTDVLAGYSLGYAFYYLTRFVIEKVENVT